MTRRIESTDSISRPSSLIRLPRYCCKAAWTRNWVVAASSLLLGAKTSCIRPLPKSGRMSRSPGVVNSTCSNAAGGPPQYGSTRFKTVFTVGCCSAIAKGPEPALLRLSHASAVSVVSASAASVPPFCFTTAASRTPATSSSSSSAAASRSRRTSPWNSRRAPPRLRLRSHFHRIQPA